MTLVVRERYNLTDQSVSFQPEEVCKSVVEGAKKAIIFTLFLAALILVGCAQSASESQRAEEMVPVMVASVIRDDIEVFRVVQGVIVPQDQRTLLAEVGGEVREVLFEEGQRVEAGQPLVLLDDAQLAAQVEQARAAVAAAEASLQQAERGASEEDLEMARAQLRQAEASYEGAKRAYDSAMSAFIDNTAARQQMEAAKAQWQSAVKARELAELSLQSVKEGPTEAELSQAQAALEAAQASYDGAVKAYDGLAELVASLEAQIDALEAEIAAALAEGRADDAETLTQQKVELELSLYQTEQQLVAAETQMKVAEINLDSARDQVELLQSLPTEEQIAMAELQLEQAKIAEESAYEAYLIAREVYENRDAAKAQLDAAYAQMQIAAANVDAARAALALAEKGASEEVIRSARAGLEQARASLRMAEDALQRASIEAPISGTVLSLLVKEGDIIGPGQPVAVIGQIDGIRVRMTLPEEVASKVREGDEVVITPVSSGESVVGTIESLDIAAVDAPGLFTAVAASSDMKAPLVGGFAEVRLVTARRQNVLTVPVDALVYAGDRTLVYVVEQEGQDIAVAREREVKVGLIHQDRAEIVAGLEDGALVIVSGAEFLDDGIRVMVQEATSE